MNWNQLYTSATPEERLEAVWKILGAIEERKQKLIFTRGRLIRERRRLFRGAHFLHDRRDRRPSLQRVASLSMFAFTLSTAIIGMAVMASHSQWSTLIYLMLVYEVTLLALLYIKPISRRLRYSTT